MNDTDAQTKGRSPDEVSPATTVLKEARAVVIRRAVAGGSPIRSKSRFFLLIYNRRSKSC